MNADVIILLILLLSASFGSGWAFSELRYCLKEIRERREADRKAKGTDR